MSKFSLRFNENKCKGCELCAEACPKGLITMSSGFNSKGYCHAQVSDGEGCTGCASCAIVCPDAVIEIYKED